MGTTRQTKPNRILLKFSGELISCKDRIIDFNRIKKLAREIKSIYKKGVELGIIFGGGNIFRGREIKDGEIQENTGHWMGIVATLINALAFKDILAKLGVKGEILSPLPFENVAKGYKARDLDRYLQKGKVLIFAGGTGRPGVTNDTAAVRRAKEMKAEIVLKVTKVAGVYDKDPLKFKKAKKFDKITYKEYLKLNLRMIVDREAVILAKKYNLPIYVFKWKKGALEKVVKGKGRGTMITNNPVKSDKMSDNGAGK